MCKNAALEYYEAGGHFSINDCKHPYHSGDLPPLFSKSGQAWMSVYIQKFTPGQIVGRTVIIHEKLMILPRSLQEIQGK